MWLVAVAVIYLFKLEIWKTFCLFLSKINSKSREIIIKNKKIIIEFQKKEIFSGNKYYILYIINNKLYIIYNIIAKNQPIIVKKYKTIQITTIKLIKETVKLILNFLKNNKINKKTLFLNFSKKYINH